MSVFIDRVQDSVLTGYWISNTAPGPNLPARRQRARAEVENGDPRYRYHVCVIVVTNDRIFQTLFLARRSYWTVSEDQMSNLEI